jgi:hypothetical protein
LVWTTYHWSKIDYEKTLENIKYYDLHRKEVESTPHARYDEGMSDLAGTDWILWAIKGLFTSFLIKSR